MQPSRSPWVCSGVLGYVQVVVNVVGCWDGTGDHPHPEAVFVHRQAVPSEENLPDGSPVVNVRHEKPQLGHSQAV